MLGAKQPEHPRHLERQLGIGHADDLMPGAGGIGERAKDVEHRPDADLLPGRAGEAHCRMEERRVHEPDSDLVNAAADRLGTQLDPDAESFKHVGRAAAAGHCPVPVLRHPHPGSGDHEGGDGRDIERSRGISAGTAGIDHRIVTRKWHSQRVLAHHFGEPGDLLLGLAPHPQRGQERADL